MYPRSTTRPFSVRATYLSLLCVLPALSACCGWDAMSFRSQSPEPSKWSLPDVRLVGDMASPVGMSPIEVESVTIVTGLRGTGSDPTPGPQRARLLSELLGRKVATPNQMLASDSTSLVLLRAILPPGAQKGDRVDVELRVPSRSETTDLTGGWLMPTRLKEIRLLKGQFHDGHVMALAKGAVLVDPAANDDRDSVLVGRGRVLGGAVVTVNRPLGLILKSDFRSAINSARIENAINKRFSTFRNGVKVGVATAKNDKYVELAVNPEYKDNIGRYMRVVRSVAMKETSIQRVERLGALEKALLDPETAAAAALQLEAMGKEAVDILCKGIESQDTEVRFYAAEALAFLDRHEAAKPLAEAARKEPAFRVFALAALSAMNSFDAHEQLRDLLSMPSVETRYGAFRALWAMNPNDALVLGEDMNGQFSYHVLDTTGPPMIHVTRSHRPEVVIFGSDQRFLPPLAVNAGNQIMVTSSSPGEISVSKFAVNEANQKRIVSTRVDEVIRAIVELGGTYPDVVQALQEAKTAGALAGRFEADALPTAGRKYDRPASARRRTPPPTGGARGRSPSVAGKANSRENTAQTTKTGNDPSPMSRFFARMTGRKSG